jgi:hypothetical protein
MLSFYILASCPSGVFTAAGAASCNTAVYGCQSFNGFTVAGTPFNWVQDGTVLQVEYTFDAHGC